MTVEQVPPLTSVEAKQARSLSYDSFAHITATPVAKGGISGDGVLFDGVLTDNEIGDIWWFATSTDNDDMTRRQSLAADRDALPVDSPLRRLYAYVLGEAL